MSETQRIVSLSRRARMRGERLCLATVVQVEGSAYRKPGARMLVTSGGERAGTISGGCLEAEVSRKAWWLTAGGARVERYSSFADEDGGVPYGLGCGGTVCLLLEQGEAVDAVLDALEQVLASRQPAVIAMALSSDAAGRASAAGLPRDAHESLGLPSAGTLGVWAATPRYRANGHRPGPGDSHKELHSIFRRTHGDDPQQHDAPCIASAEPCWTQLAHAAETAFAEGRSCLLTASFEPYATPPYGLEANQAAPAYFIEYLAAPPALTIFGAGDDAQPLAELAHALGWRVTVVDGRSHLARRERFPQAAEVRVLNYADPALRAACGMASSSPVKDSVDSGHLPAGPAGHRHFGEESDAIVTDDEIAVILTHSYEQDRALLASLLPRELVYLGLLGPRHRTKRLLEEVAPLAGLSVAEGFARLHSPIGLNLGGGEPAAVALAIIAEIQSVLHGRHVTVTRRNQPPALPEIKVVGATAVVTLRD